MNTDNIIGMRYKNPIIQPKIRVMYPMYKSVFNAASAISLIIRILPPVLHHLQVLYRVLHLSQVAEN